jgi:diguanylate cyclase (GGDEF)-like protein
MAEKSVSLAEQLVLTLVGLVLITTTVLTIAAYRSVHSNLENEARRTVRGAAEQTARTLTRLLEQQHERAQGFLSAVESLCGETTPSGRTAWERSCLDLALAEFRATEHVRGARFEYQGRVAQVGDLASPDLALPWPLARVVSHPQGHGYLLMATNGRSALTIEFSLEQLDVLFRDHAVLGTDGEIFLMDANGQFLTTVRYPESSVATHVEPIADCAQGPRDLIGLDYRGVQSFHGIRPVPLFFGGACVDAHLGYEEALAPADALFNRLAIRGIAFAFVGMILSFVATGWIVGPVRRLARSARALGDGKFDRPIPIAGPSEIRALGRGLAKMARALADLALHDPLTNLPNRRLLNERLVQAIAMSSRYGGHLAVLFLDLDRFKHINDSLGHESGDRLLQSVATRLLGCVRSSDTVSRLGGDEFVLVLPDVEGSAGAARSAQKVIFALEEAHHIVGQELHVNASIGISLYPDDGYDAETLLKNADTAMYHAKEHGRNTYQFFKADMNARAVERRWIERDLRRALVRREFVLDYQPKIDLVTGEVTGAEALIRWMHPERGPISPSQFVPIAEDSGFIVPIGQWVLGEACRQARAWIDEGLRPTPISVNISAVEFRDKDFLERVCAVLETNRLSPELLELELTESVLMQHAESTAALLQALKHIGVRIAIDDFGTGYSSLSYLRQFPIDVLKIDQSFVREITAQPAGPPILTAVISMGRGLNHRVIAEGVETAGQLSFLQANECGEGQGFYFSHPVPAARFAELLQVGLPDTIHH